MVINMKRSSGVLMHISSLPGDFSIGSFGKNAKYFIDFLAEAGFKFWQVLPFGITDEYNSPYKSVSAFAGNPYFIDLEILYQNGLITKAELDGERQKTEERCEFEKLKKRRVDLLKRAAVRAQNREEIEGFIGGEPHLFSFCSFMAKREKCDEFWWKFIQFEFFRQWSELKKYANEKDIKIIGDLPFYVAPDSCDFYENNNLFKSGEVAGVPPDYFNENGQLWGNPLYNWEEMKKDGFEWWKERIAFMSKLFDAVRIDHFRAIESYFAVPEGAKTARTGGWLKGPGMELIDVIKAAAGGTQIIAEDLGNITPEVSELVKKSGFPSMRVFQFGFGENEDSPHLPKNYPESCVAYTGTHDNTTLKDFLKGKEKVSSVIEEIFKSRAGLVILPIQDVLGLGGEARMNVPGRADGNWGFRVTKEQLDGIDKDYFKSLNKKCLR